MSAEPAASRTAMNRAGGVAYCAAAALILVLFARDARNALLWLHDFSGGAGMFALGLAGAALASFGPFALSLWCWRLAERVHAKWAVHLFFIPCACLMVRAGASLLDLADGRAGTAEPADHALSAAFLLLALTVSAHAAALAREAVAAIRRRDPDTG